MALLKNARRREQGENVTIPALSQNTRKGWGTRDLWRRQGSFDFGVASLREATPALRMTVV